MTTLPEGGIGLEADEVLAAARPLGLWHRAVRMASDRMGYALADQVVYSFGNMVVAALLSRHAAQREFGIYILTQRSMDVLIQLSNVFLWAPFTFNLPGTEDERKRSFLGSLVMQQVLACVLAALLLWGLGAWSQHGSRLLYRDTFAPLAVTSIAILFREFNRRMYFCYMRFKAAFWTDLATVALQIVGVEALYKTHRLTVPNTLVVLSAGCLIVSIYWLITEWASFVVRLRDTRNDFAHNFRLGRWLLGSNMVFMISSQCNPWVIGSLLGGVSVGAYTKCESVVNIPRVALTSLQNTMAPMLARSYHNGGKPALTRLVSRFNRLLLIGSILFAVGIIAVGPFVAEAIFKGAPANSRVILAVLSLNFVAFAMTMAQSYGLTAMNRARLTFYANLVGMVTQAGVILWLVRSYQLPGAAAALLVGSVVVLFVRQFFYRRETRTA
ncbi:MAG: lipopolysaccharide biosynthesis protein [Acidobacteriaceae bacterium]|nr:lipopolysaccharide biosynthesis protein [Acidobacteriaceae bacterium]